MSDAAKAAAPTPETDAIMATWRIDEATIKRLMDHARTLERQRDEARAERDKAIANAKDRLRLINELRDGLDKAEYAVEESNKLKAERDTALASLATAQQDRDALLAELKGAEDHCPKCGSGLRYCGPQDPVTHIPAVECRLCQLMARVERLETALKESHEDTKRLDAFGKMIEQEHESCPMFQNGKWGFPYLMNPAGCDAAAGVGFKSFQNLRAAIDEALSDLGPYMVRPSGASSVRTVASKDGVTWVDLATIDLPAPPGAPPVDEMERQQAAAKDFIENTIPAIERAREAQHKNPDPIPFKEASPQP